MPPLQFRINSNSLLIVLLLGVIFFLSVNTLADFDTGYHLKTGEYIWQTHTVPLYDIFSYTSEGARWITHYWLADVIFYGIYSLFKEWGLMLGSALVALLTYFVILKTVKLRTKNVLLPVLILLPYSYLTYELWVIRPQIFSYLFVALLVFILEKWRLKEDAGAIYFLPLLFLVWANSHASVILGLSILLLYFVTPFVTKELRLQNNGKLFFIGLTSVAAVFLNPNGLDVLNYSAIIAPVAKELNILEWNSLLTVLNLWQAKVFVGLMVATTLFVIWRLFDKAKTFREFDLISFGLICGAFVLPLISVRHVGLFPIIAFPVLIRELEGFLSYKQFDLENIRGIKSFLLFIFAVSIVLSASKLPDKPLVNIHELPVGAVAFIKANSVAGPMLNTPALGGYLIWKLWPEEKVFMDGRSEVYLGKTNKDLLTIMRLEPGYEDLINEKYKFNYFLLYYRRQINFLTNSLVDKLTNNLGFKLVYWDDSSILLVKNNDENEAVTTKFSYEFINPYRHPRDIPEDKLKEAISEMKRALDIAPDSVILRNYADQLLQRAPTQN